MITGIARTAVRMCAASSTTASTDVNLRSMFFICSLSGIMHSDGDLEVANDLRAIVGLRPLVDLNDTGVDA